MLRFLRERRIRQNSKPIRINAAAMPATAPPICAQLGLLPLLLAGLWVCEPVDRPVRVWVVDAESFGDSLFGSNDSEVEVDDAVDVEVAVEADWDAVVFADVDIVDGTEEVEKVDTLDVSAGGASMVAGEGLSLLASLLLLSSSGQTPVLQGSAEQHPRNGPLEQTYQALPPEQDILCLLDEGEQDRGQA